MGNCDDVYTERNALIAALTKFLPSVMIHDSEAEEGWKHIIYVHGSEGQMSWPIGDDDLHLFSHLPINEKPSFSVWDGHTTEEKYERLGKIKGPAEEFKTVLTYEQALAVHEALRQACEVERMNLKLEALRGNGMGRSSMFLNRLEKAEHIMDVRRERADDMGG